MNGPPLSSAPTSCPECGHGLTRTVGYLVWCEACGWNVDPVKPAEPVGRLERIERRLAIATGTREHDRLRGGPLPRAGRDTVSVASLVIAAAIHAFTAAVLAGGVAVLIVGWPNFFAIVLGVIALGAAWLMRPRLSGVPRDAIVLDPVSSPVLHDLVDRVSRAVSGPPVDKIVLDHEPNASLGRVGLRRHVLLTVGLPLWAALSAEEKVAILGHEIGHAVNGDSRRGVLVGSALDTLAEWYGALRPPGSIGDEIAWIAAVFLRVALAPVRGLIRALYVVEVKLLTQSGQRAEYLADGLAARAASTSAAVSALDKTLAMPSVVGMLQRAAVRRDATDLREVVRTHVRTIPPLEWERLRRVAAARGHQVDSSHPPTALRRDLLISRAAEPAAVWLSPADEARIDAELSPHVAALQKKLYDELVFTW